jgi:hypothetical protein
MSLTRMKRRWHRRALVVAAVILSTGLATLNVGRALAAGGGTDVNNAGVFELDGDVTHEAATTPPYDWANLFTSTGARVTGLADLVNSTFTPDPTTTDVAFITGSSKDTIDVSSWMCTTKPVTPKDEIQNSYAAAFIAPSGSPVAGHVLLYMGLERGTVSGTSNAGFWIFKQPTACNPSTGTFVNPNTGAPVGHSDGDILLFASFTSGGTSASISLFTWRTACTSTSVSGCTSTSPTGGLSTPINGQDCPTSNLNLCGIANGTAPITTPWAPGSVGTNGFFEAGIDLTATVPGALSSSCFSTILADTRSSASVTSDLHDFNSGSFSLCATPTLATSAAQTSNIVGAATTSDTATLSGFVGSVSGEPVTFNLFGPFSTPQSSNFCTASPPPTPLFSGSATLNSSGVASINDPNTLSTVGTYYWVASYPGDRGTGGLNLPAQSGCTDEPVTVVKASPTIATTAGAQAPNPGIVGSPVSTTDTATLTGAFNPTGTVTFELLSSACDATKPLKTVTTTTISAGSGGTFTATTGPVSFTPAAVDTFYWVASYSGDASNNPAPPSGFSTCPDPSEAVPVVKATPNLNTIMFLGDIATISHGFNPTGTITFKLFSNASCTGTPVYTLANVPLSNLSANTLADLSAHLASAELADGNTYSWLVSYSGDNNNNSVTVGCGTVSTESTGTITQH